MSKLSNVVKNEVAKKTVYDELVKRANNIDDSGFALKTKYQTDKTKLEKNFLMWVILLKNQIIILKFLK